MQSREQKKAGSHVKTTVHPAASAQRWIDGCAARTAVVSLGPYASDRTRGLPLVFRRGFKCSSLEDVL